MRYTLPTLAVAVIAIAAAPGAMAQPVDLPVAASDGSPLPPGIGIRKDAGGHSVYVDRQGRVLYGMDMRTVLRWAPDPAKYCTDDCKAEWQPVLAPKGATANIRFPRGNREDLPAGTVNPQKAPDWTVIDGVDGPQWVYKGWHAVFTHRVDGRSTAFDGAGNFTWNSLKYVPPMPVAVLPATVTVQWVDARYVLASLDRKLLFTGHCPAPCSWRPLAAPMASQGVKDWTVSLAGDTPQWLRKGKPVFVAADEAPAALPRGGALIEP